MIPAGATLHHLRGEEKWRRVFSRFHVWLKPGGSLWIVDLIAHSAPQIHEMMWQRYGDYLTQFKREAYREAYREQVFAYIEQEGMPSPPMVQLGLLREVGFAQGEVLHKNGCFAAFDGIKQRLP